MKLLLSLKKVSEKYVKFTSQIKQFMSYHAKNLKLEYPSVPSPKPTLESYQVNSFLSLTNATLSLTVHKVVPNLSKTLSSSRLNAKSNTLITQCSISCLKNTRRSAQKWKWQSTTQIKRKFSSNTQQERNWTCASYVENGSKRVLTFCSVHKKEKKTTKWLK